jgi:hypothetical protein
MTQIDSSRRALAVFGALFMAGLAAPAVAASKKKSGSSHKSKKDKPASSEAERRKQEDARLTRECRGRPNAGACLGYARP